MWVRFPPGPPRSRLILLAVVSAALHLLVVLLLLMRPPQPPISDSQPDAAEVAMVFSAASPRQASAPKPGNGPAAQQAQKREQPRHEQPPNPQPAPKPTPPQPAPKPAPPQPAPKPAPPQPAPKPAPKPAPPQPAAKPAPGPPVVARPAVPLGQEQVNLPPLPSLVEPLPTPTAPAPLSLPERGPAPSTGRAASRLPSTLQFAAPRSRDVPARPTSRGFSLAGAGSILDPYGLDVGGRNVRRGASHESVSSDLRGAEAAGPDWGAALLGWVDEHKHYPEQAIARAEDGDSTVDVTVDRYGKVHDVVLVGPSGSRYLDAGLEGLFRGQTLPPFPLDIGKDTMTFTFVMHYILER